jgi:hypothetical protein
MVSSRPLCLFFFFFSSSLSPAAIERRLRRMTATAGRNMLVRGLVETNRK